MHYSQGLPGAGHDNGRGLGGLLTERRVDVATGKQRKVEEKAFASGPKKLKV